MNQGLVERTDRPASGQRSPASQKIWIDLENSPHVPFFKPIIEELKARGYSVMLTARDCFQVCALADMFHLDYQLFGRHYGKHTIAKAVGLGIRVVQMAPAVRREKPDLAISHGSRSLFVLANLLHIPTITICDYEHVKWANFSKSSWFMLPDVIPDHALNGKGVRGDHILKYPGIKEDVYAPFFEPDPSINARLGVAEEDLVVTIRPPATEAHYHNPEAEILLDAVLELLQARPDVKVILLPRTEKQGTTLRDAWKEPFRQERFMIPAQVVDGLDLIWYSDLVISGGGTMNREAAALGVPVYSIFRGKLGAVDKYLADTNRLVLLRGVEDVRNKLVLSRRDKTFVRGRANRVTLNAVVDHIVRVLGER